MIHIASLLATIKGRPSPHLELPEQEPSLLLPLVPMAAYDSVHSVSALEPRGVLAARHGVQVEAAAEHVLGEHVHGDLVVGHLDGLRAAHVHLEQPAIPEEKILKNIDFDRILQGCLNPLFAKMLSLIRGGRSEPYQSRKQLNSNRCLTDIHLEEA